MIHFHLSFRRRRGMSEKGNRQVTYWIATIRADGSRFRGRTRAEALGRAVLSMQRALNRQSQGGAA